MIKQLEVRLDEFTSAPSDAAVPCVCLRIPDRLREDLWRQHLPSPVNPALAMIPSHWASNKGDTWAIVINQSVWRVPEANKLQWLYNREIMPTYFKSGIHMISAKQIPLI